MTQPEILAELSALARAHLDHQQLLRAETRLVEELRLDSLRLLTLVVEVENRFQICLDEEGTAATATAGELAARIGELLGEREADGSTAAGQEGEA